MSIENQFGGLKNTPPPPPADEQIPRPSEKLKGHRKNLWDKAKALLNRFGYDFNGKNNLAVEKEAISKINEVKNNNEDDKFLDLELERGGENLTLRTVAQIDQKYDPACEKNYAVWDLTTQEEAERWLNREILVNEKLGAKDEQGKSKFLISSEDIFSADELVEANHDAKAGPMFLLKRIKAQEKNQEQYGEAEGRALAKALLNMQSKLNATGMIKEIMAENNIKTKLEMEQKIFEDYFDNFDGYMDNLRDDIFKDLDDEEMEERLTERMEKFREIIKGRQLKKDEYSFVHGNINFETVRYSEDGRAYLSDWQRAGKTQNKELSLVYDLGSALQEAIEKLDIKQAEAFIGGIELEISDHYKNQPEVAEAVINLSKFRSFAEILNEQEEDDKKDLVLKGLGELG